MPYQEVIDGAGSSLPDRQDEQTFIDVKTGSAYFAMLYSKVLGSEQFSKRSFLNKS